MIFRVLVIAALYLQSCLAFWDIVKYPFYLATDFMNVETCRDPWIQDDITALEQDLRNKVYGQPFVGDSLIPLLTNFVVRPDRSRKALSLSFHGTPGTGKNYVADFIAKRLYKLGFKSKYVHYYKGATDFTNPYSVSSYKLELISLIKSSTASCPRQLFIFDEVHLMPSGILDVIRGFIDYEASNYKESYRRTIFIFLSNIAREAINKETLDFWQQNVKREDFPLFPFQKLIANAAYDESGGLKASSMITSSLIDMYVPFLPLEKVHVVMCIRAEINRMSFICDKDQSNQIVMEVLNNVDFEPDDLNVYAAHGCKNINVQVILAAKKLRCSSLQTNLLRDEM